jgi:hypothetical protein
MASTAAFSAAMKAAMTKPIYECHLAHMEAHRTFLFGIRKRTAWQDAIAWLEQRQAVEEEWPWPSKTS